MSLSPLDDFPVHQIAEPIRRVGSSDRNFYDRYYFNLHALDEELCLIAGFGAYPNLGTFDGFAVIVHEGQHTVVRASRELGTNRLDTSVGPFRVEVIEGLRKLRVVLDPNEWGFDFDLTFTGSIPAQEEPRHFWRQNERVIFDTCRLAQTGRWEGAINIGGKQFGVEPQRWWGCRDRSWGIRTVGEPEPPGIRAARPTSMFWNYAQIQFDDYSLIYMAQEDRDGGRVLEEALRVWNDPTRPPEHLGPPTHELEFVPGTRRVSRGTLTLGEADGKPVIVEVVAGLPIYLGIGTGYGQEPDWRHGMYHGPLKVEGLTVDLNDPASGARMVGVVDTVGRFEHDGNVGYGLWEYAIAGPHASTASRAGPTALPRRGDDMPIPAQRDPDVTAKAIASWLQDRIDGAHEMVVTNLSVPATSGFSNETIMAEASWTDPSGRPASEQLVVRVKPTGYQVFLESDFERQHQLLAVLGTETEVAVPPLLWTEDDPSVLGAPFFVMRKVPGQPAPDQPPYNQAGWLAEATPEQREQVWRNAIAALVEVHRVPADKVSFLAKPDLGTTGFDQLFEYWRRSFVWAARGHPQPVAEAALEWLERNRPAERPTALSWGDARIGNILFDGTKVSAVVDWEMLSLGGHLVDLGWWLFLDDFHSFDVPRLPGLGSRADTIACWEAGTGERATDLDWYEMFAGFRFAIVMMRLIQMFEAFGLPRDDRADPERNNPVTHLLARRLDVEPPGSLSPSS